MFTFAGLRPQTRKQLCAGVITSRAMSTALCRETGGNSQIRRRSRNAFIGFLSEFLHVNPVVKDKRFQAVCDSRIAVVVEVGSNGGNGFRIIE